MDARGPDVFLGGVLVTGQGEHCVLGSANKGNIDEMPHTGGLGCIDEVAVPLQPLHALGSRDHEDGSGSGKRHPRGSGVLVGRLQHGGSLKHRGHARGPDQ